MKENKRLKYYYIKEHMILGKYEDGNRYVYPHSIERVQELKDAEIPERSRYRWDHFSVPAAFGLLGIAVLSFVGFCFWRAPWLIFLTTASLATSLSSFSAIKNVQKVERKFDQIIEKADLEVKLLEKRLNQLGRDLGCEMDPNYIESTTYEVDSEDSTPELSVLQSEDRPKVLTKRLGSKYPKN